MAALWILLRFQHLLHPKEKALVHDLGDAALDADVPVDVDAGVSFVGEQSVEAVLPPLASPAGLYAPGIQICSDVNERLPAGHPAEDLPDDLILRGIEGVPHILALLVAEGEAAVCDFALGRVVVKPALDVLGHVLGIELVDVHHGAEGEAAGRGVIEVLLGVKHPDSKVVQLSLVHHGLKHIAAHAV